MQYRSLKPGTWWVPQSQPRPGAPDPAAHPRGLSSNAPHPGVPDLAAPPLTVGVFGQQVLGAHDGDFQGA